MVFLRKRFDCRKGSFVVEAVVAAALFSTAVLACSRLALSTAKLSVRADQQLAAQLTAENVLAQLRATPFDQIDSVTQALQTRAKESSGLDVQIESEPFTAGQRDALKLTVKVDPIAKRQSGQVNWMTLYDWRIDDPPPTTPPSEETSSEETPSEETPAEETGADDE